MIFRHTLHPRHRFARIADNNNEVSDALAVARGIAIGVVVSLMLWTVIIVSVYELAK